MTSWHCSQNVILTMLSFIKHQPLPVISAQTDKFMWLSYKKDKTKMAQQDKQENGQLVWDEEWRL